MAADKLWDGALGLLGRGGLNLNGSITGAIGPTSVGGAPLVGAFAGGTDSAPGGWSLIGERGPEIMNIPRGAQIIPNDIARNMGGGGNGPITYAPTINAPGASAEAVARIEVAMARERATFEARTVAAIRKARMSRMPGV